MKAPALDQFEAKCFGNGTRDGDIFVHRCPDQRIGAVPKSGARGIIGERPVWAAMISGDVLRKLVTGMERAARMASRAASMVSVAGPGCSV